tara:strand:- start:2245 stop:2943 length:699 start_codon:yes stop_codon:yes gene_type:complete
MTTAIGYIRVSTKKQSDTGVSLSAQRRKIEMYAELHDINLIDIVVDAGVSASGLDRTGLNKAIELLQDGTAQALIVTKLDRLTRSVKDLGFLIEGIFSKFSLMSVGESIDTRSAAGRLVLNILSSVSQWERESVGERTKNAMAHKKANNEYTGGKLPFGKQLAEDGIHLEDNEKEIRIIELAYSLRKGQRALRNGKAYTINEVAEYLNKSGHSNRGRTWNYSSTYRMMKGKM